MLILIVHAEEEEPRKIALEVGDCLDEHIKYSKVGYEVGYSNSPDFNELGSSKSHSLVALCERLLGAVVVLTDKDGAKREDVLIKYAVLVGAIGFKRAVLCLYEGMPSPVGLGDIEDLKWNSSCNSGEMRRLGHWLESLKRYVSVGSGVETESKEEELVLLEMYGRDDNYGYTTQSHIEALLPREKLDMDDGIVKYTIEGLKDKGFIIERHISRVRTFFITAAGIVEVCRLRNRPRKKAGEFKWNDGNSDLTPPRK